MLFGWLQTAPAGAAVSEDKKCPNGAYVADLSYCEAIKYYDADPNRVVDRRIEARFPPATIDDPKIRSFALVVVNDEYPNFVPDTARTLPGVTSDMPRIVAFLKGQQFDEIIVLHNPTTRQEIDYFLDTYLYKRLRDSNRRSRFLFAYDGHGGPPAADGEAGSLSLAQSHGETDADTDSFYPISVLQPKLKALGAFAYQSVALLGSCFSGGIFQPVDPGHGQNYSFPASPGAHAITAARADQLAWAAPDGSGTIFFAQLLAAVDRVRAPDERMAGPAFSLNNGQIVRLPDEIVRLGRVIQDINESLEDPINPVTKQHYPQLLVGSLSANPAYNGAFFFLAPKPASTDAQTATLVELARTRDTGSAIEGYPGLKIFNAPETYSVRGVDLSHHNAEVNFGALAADKTIRFVYLKATEGETFVDKTFAERSRAAASSNLLVGAYHVFRACAAVDAQTANLTKTVPAGVVQMPVAIDLGPYFGSFATGDRKCGDVDAVRQRLRAFISAIETAYHKKPVIYGPKQIFDSLIDASFDDVAIWLGDYSKGNRFGQTGPTLAGSNPWSIWQFTDTATLDGVKGPVDLNAFFGSPDQFETFVQSGGNIALTASASARRAPVSKH